MEVRGTGFTKVEIEWLPLEEAHKFNSFACDSCEFSRIISAAKAAPILDCYLSPKVWFWSSWPPSMSSIEEEPASDYCRMCWLLNFALFSI